MLCVFACLPWCVPARVVSYVVISAHDVTACVRPYVSRPNMSPVCRLFGFVWFRPTTRLRVCACLRPCASSSPPSASRPVLYAINPINPLIPCLSRAVFDRLALNSHLHAHLLGPCCLCMSIAAPLLSDCRRAQKGWWHRPASRKQLRAPSASPGAASTCVAVSHPPTHGLARSNFLGRS